MKFYDEQLQKLQEQSARKRQLEAQVSELRTQRSTLSTRVRELEAIKMQEQADVDKLEGRSLAAFFYSFPSIHSQGWNDFADYCMYGRGSSRGSASRCCPSCDFRSSLLH